MSLPEENIADICDPFFRSAEQQAAGRVNPKKSAVGPASDITLQTLPKHKIDTAHQYACFPGDIVDEIIAAS